MVLPGIRWDPLGMSIQQLTYNMDARDNDKNNSERGVLANHFYHIFCRALLEIP